MSRKDLRNLELSQQVGYTVRMLRAARQWTLEEVSQRVGTSIPALSKIENGITDMSISRLQQLADLFEVTPGYLLGEAAESSAEKDQQIIALQGQVIELLQSK